MKILVSDPVWEEGIDFLRKYGELDIKTGLKPEELISIIGEYDALIVRSQTKVTSQVIEAGRKLQIIGRAGVGVDNIDVDAATRHGIIVVNAPTGNTISAAEHSVALMMALARNIPQANSVLKTGAWRRNDFMGVEVRGKTLGLIGLGNVGSEVARRAHAMEMRVIANDPFISADHARNLQVELVPFKQLLKDSDFISLHVPVTDSTKGMIGQKELAQVKPSIRIINTARGGLIDEEALVKALREKKVAGAAFDVFVTEPITSSILFEEENIIVTPHLGASTTRLARQLVEEQVDSIRIRYQGEISNYDTNILKVGVLGGLLEDVSEERINLVNANLVASRRGLSVVEQKETACENYSSMVTAEVVTRNGTVAVATTVMRGQTRIVRVNDYWIDIEPAEGNFLFMSHRDRPGMLGAVGRVTGDADINISSMHVGRLEQRGQALAVLSLDEPLPEEQRQQILSIPDVYNARVVKL
jgi:D-3-phosphoglycerate dehydrogenase